MKQTSYVMVKPEFANHSKVIGEIKGRLKLNGLEIVDEAYIKYDKARARRHYAEHAGKDFYPNLETYITSDKAYGMIVEGENAIALIRQIVGATKNPAVGTIRHDIPQYLGLEERVTQNVVHASDKPESAKVEIEIFKELSKEANREII